MFARTEEKRERKQNTLFRFRRSGGSKLKGKWDFKSLGLSLGKALASSTRVRERKSSSSSTEHRKGSTSSPLSWATNFSRLFVSSLRYLSMGVHWSRLKKKRQDLDSLRVFKNWVNQFNFWFPNWCASRKCLGPMDTLMRHYVRKKCSGSWHCPENAEMVP